MKPSINPFDSNGPQLIPEHPRSRSFARSDAHRLYILAWNLLAEDDVLGLSEICDPDFKFTMPGATNARMDVMQHIARLWRQAFWNFGLHRDDLTIFFDGNDKLAVRDRHTLTHTAAFMMPNGETLPASGNTVTLFGAHFVRTRNGRILRWDIIFDTTSLKDQIERQKIQPGLGWPRSGLSQSPEPQFHSDR